MIYFASRTSTFVRGYGDFKLGVDIGRFIEKGEGIDIEFKESRTALPKDVYESACAFLNRVGGHILLGVKNDGTVTGVEPSEVEKIKSAFVTTINNPNMIKPTFYTTIEEYEVNGEIVLYVHIPCSSQVHRLNGRFFDRNEDADIDITDSVMLVADLFNRKGNVYTEIRVFPHVSLNDIEPQCIERVRKMAYERKGDKSHLWESLSDFDLLRSANLYGKDPNTGKEGMNLAGILLLGSKQLIISVLPHHQTDAIVRIEDLDRYDDRDVICENLVESYYRLMAFVEKHLNDSFYLEGDQRVSIRNIIFREVCSNLLMHREFSNAFPAKLIIEGTKVWTENANRPNGYGEIDASNFSPFPKNPIIASFFREIGLADTLGSGVKNVNKYMDIYSGEKPHFVEGNIFKLLLPLGKNSSNKRSSQLSDQASDQVGDQASDQVSDLAVQKILEFCRTPKSKAEIMEYTGYKHRTHFSKYILKPLLDSKQLQPTIPEKPTSPLQKYVTLQ